jgi:hypothetical protein
MPSNAILDEVQQLYSVSDRLDSLAEQHPLVSEALINVSGIVNQPEATVDWISWNQFRAALTRE